MARKRVRIAVVTDSTAYLPKPVWDAVTVVPLSVVLSGVDGLEGVDISAADVAAALEERRPDVTTSRPSPQAFVEAYDRLFATGAKGIVSVHLSSELSGTYESAALAATDYGDRVAVVDTRSTGMG